MSLSMSLKSLRNDVEINTQDVTTTLLLNLTLKTRSYVSVPETGIRYSESCGSSLENSCGGDVVGGWAV